MRHIAWEAPFAALLWLLVAPANAEEPAGNNVIVLTTIVPKDDHPLGKLVDRIYRDAFGRLGLVFVYRYRPPLRGTLEAENGRVDGEMGRGADYGAAHPNLVRVREPVLHLTLAAYTANPNITLGKWDDFRLKKYRTEYRMGMLMPKSRLTPRVQSDLLSSVPATLHGLKKLAAGRTDVYVDFEEYVEPLLRAEQFMNIERIVKAGTMERVAIHAYLANKHAKLEPRLSEVLRKMKKEGVVDRYREELFLRE